jgi:hypothetical protein
MRVFTLGTIRVLARDGAVRLAVDDVEHQITAADAEALAENLRKAATEVRGAGAA